VVIFFYCLSYGLALFFAVRWGVSVIVAEISHAQV